MAEIRRLRNRVSKAMPLAKDVSERKHLVSLIKRLSLAEIYCEPSEAIKRTSTSQGDMADGEYESISSESDETDALRRIAESMLTSGDPPSPSSAEDLCQIVSSLTIVESLLTSIAKYFYCTTWAKFDVEGMYRGERWKGKYTILIEDMSGRTIIAAEGARDLAMAFGISVKSATDRLSRVFPGKQGKGTKKIVFDGRKCIVWFLLEEE